MKKSYIFHDFLFLCLWIENAIKHTWVSIDLNCYEKKKRNNKSTESSLAYTPYAKATHI